MERVEPRRYRGITSDERRTQRRQKLMDAALELFGTVGYANTSIREICATAGLNQRYFYESFSDRAEMLAELYGQIVSDLTLRVASAAYGADGLEGKARAGLTVWWEVLAADPRKARIVCIESVGVSHSLEARQLETRQLIADFVISQARSLPELAPRLREGELELHVRWLCVGTIDLMADWLRGDVDRTVEELIEECTRRFVIVGREMMFGPRISTAGSTPGGAPTRRAAGPAAGARGRSGGRAARAL